MTVRQLHAELSAGELTEWMAFARLEPFGGPVEDYRAGVVASLLFNAHRGRETAPAGPLEFIPWASEEARAAKEQRIETLSPEETARAIAAAMGRADYK